MTVEELLELIGNLFRSAKTHGVQANFGCGAKIAGARFSPRGVEYRSWRNGAGQMICLHEHGSAWGLKALRPERSGADRSSRRSATVIVRDCCAARRATERP